MNGTVCFLTSFSLSLSYISSFILSPETQDMSKLFSPHFLSVIITLQDLAIKILHVWTLTACISLFSHFILSLQGRKKNQVEKKEERWKPPRNGRQVLLVCENTRPVKWTDVHTRKRERATDLLSRFISSQLTRLPRGENSLGERGEILKTCIKGHRWNERQEKSTDDTRVKIVKRGNFFLMCANFYPRIRKKKKYIEETKGSITNYLHSFC